MCPTASAAVCTAAMTAYPTVRATMIAAMRAALGSVVNATRVCCGQTTARDRAECGVVRMDATFVQWATMFSVGRHGARGHFCGEGTFKRLNRARKVEQDRRPEVYRQTGIGQGKRPALPPIEGVRPRLPRFKPSTSPIRQSRPTLRNHRCFTLFSSYPLFRSSGIDGVVLMGRFVSFCGSSRFFSHAGPPIFR